MKHVRSLMKKVGRGEGGFTLIELLVVIAILGIIAAVVVLNVGDFFGRGRVQSANTEAHQVQTAVIAYMAEENLSDFDGQIGPATATGAEAYLMDQGLLQATYTVTDGKLVSAVLITDSKWNNCAFASGAWTCT